MQEKKSLGACNSTYQRRWQGKGELRIPCPSRSLAPLLRETTGGLWLARRNEQPHLPVPHHAQAGLKSGEHDADRCHIPSIASLAGLAHDPLLVRGLRKKKPCKAISQAIKSRAWPSIFPQRCDHASESRTSSTTANHNKISIVSLT